MTTIAVNRNEMACDLQFTHSSGIKFKGKTKIIELKPQVALEMFGQEKVLIGFCGNADAWGHLVVWFDNPTTKLPKFKELELLMLTGSHEIFHATTLDNWMYLDVNHFSIGSGSHLAMGAMEAGKTPAEAVKLASKFDPNTGQGVKTYTV